jgi:membrane associated rhomboid family serine protease
VKKESSDNVSKVIILISLLAIIWGVFLFEAATSIDLGTNGIIPRRISGLDGIAFAPFLHANAEHIQANSIPLAIFGGLVILRSIGRFFAVTIWVILVGGLGVWLFGRTACHIGASGLIFGYFGYLLAGGIFERRVLPILLTVTVGYFYSHLLFGVLPSHPSVSWEGHLCGLFSGILAAWFSFNKHAESEESKRYLCD